MFAKHGVDVLGVDIKQEAVDMLKGGTIHIEEPGLQEALEEVLETGKFRASTTAEEADAYIIAVPTPNNNDEHKSADISIVMSGVKSIVTVLNNDIFVIIYSTIHEHMTL